MTTRPKNSPRRSADTERHFSLLNADRTSREGPPPSTTGNVAVEHHYTVAEIAEQWNLSRDTIRRIFRNQEGVLIYRKDNRKTGTRPYETMRIPESVRDRVHSNRCFGNRLP
jgi:AraC-like DNA-binding protein